MNSLTCQWSKQDNGVVLKLGGQFWLADAAEFDAQMETIFEQKPARLIVDLSALDAISSAGLGSLLKLQHRARQQDLGICLTALQDNIEEVIRAARLDKIFTIS